MNKIEGTVWYRERMVLPPDAQVSITLEDVARMDVNAELIAVTRVKPQCGPPWTFTLAYDPAKIYEKGRYTLRARIVANGRLIFTSTEHMPAFDWKETRQTSEDHGVASFQHKGKGECATTKTQCKPDKHLLEAHRTAWRAGSAGCRGEGASYGTNH